MAVRSKSHKAQRRLRSLSDACEPLTAGLVKAASNTVSVSGLEMAEIGECDCWDEGSDLSSSLFLTSISIRPLTGARYKLQHALPSLRLKLRLRLRLKLGQSGTGRC